MAEKLLRIVSNNSAFAINAAKFHFLQSTCCAADELHVCFFFVKMCSGNEQVDDGRIFLRASLPMQNLLEILTKDQR